MVLFALFPLPASISWEKKALILLFRGRYLKLFIINFKRGQQTNRSEDETIFSISTNSGAVTKIDENTLFRTR